MAAVFASVEVELTGCSGMAEYHGIERVSTIRSV